ncbi:MAG: DUF4271 domain-containing protein [Bacteroidetes bacterium]|nr:MAG: DUF4271 domain-containing protein [Bacteroidota bacterium]
MQIFLLMAWQKRLVWVTGLLFTLSSIHAQGGNPFELSPRLAREAQATPATGAASLGSARTDNPFELQPRLNPDQLQITSRAPSVRSNPFDLAPRQPDRNITVLSSPPRSPVLQEGEAANDGDTAQPATGWLLVGMIGLLSLTAVFYILFQGLYRKAYRAMWSDNMMSQLYRERSSGQLGSFILTYLLFLLSAAFFLTLAAQKLGYKLSPGTHYSYLLVFGALTAVFLAKHLVLAILGYVFPVGNEARRYSFSIMVFAIVLGPVLALASLAVAYTSPQLQFPFIYLTGGIVLAAYFIRSVRGLFIANRLVRSYFFHFLLYLCAIEIIPLLWMYKLVFST